MREGVLNEFLQPFQYLLDFLNAENGSHGSRGAQECWRADGHGGGPDRPPVASPGKYSGPSRLWSI